MPASKQPGPTTLVSNLRYIPTSWDYANLMTKPLAKLQFARILDLCVNPEMKGMAGAEEEAPKEDEMAYVIMLNSDMVVKE